MSVLKVSDIDKNLQKKGFVSHSGDHIYYFFYDNNKKTDIFTKVSHSADEIGDPLISRMSKQLKLSKDQFIKFAKCIISENEYKEILKEGGYL